MLIDLLDRRSIHMIAAADLALARSPSGQLLRYWRRLRGLSQLELAVGVGTSPRHVSFLETGRSRPRRDLILRLAEFLDVPQRGLDEWFAAAGLTTAAPHAELDQATLSEYQRAVANMLELPTPFPAMIVGRTYEPIAVNDAAKLVLPNVAHATTIVDAFLTGPAREQMANPDAVAWGWYDRLIGDRTDDVRGECHSIIARLDRHLRGVPRPPSTGLDTSVIRPVFRFEGRLVRTIIMTAQVRLGRGVGVLPMMEVLYPSDAEAERFFARG